MALPIDWEAISWLWSLDGYPSDPAHAQFAGKSLRGMRIWKVGGGAYDPAAAEAAARRQAGEFLAAIAARLRDFAAAARPPRPARLRDRHRAARPLVVGGADLAARRCSTGAEAAGVRLLTVPAGARRARAGRARRCAASTWGEDKDLRTWDSPAGRRPRLGRAAARAARCCGRSRGGLRGDAARARRARAARRPGERLGLPRPARPGGRLRLPARHRPRRGDARGHRLRLCHRPAHALPRPGPEPRSAAGALAPDAR